MLECKYVYYPRKLLRAAEVHRLVKGNAKPTEPLPVTVVCAEVYPVIGIDFACPTVPARRIGGEDYKGILPYAAVFAVYGEDRRRFYYHKQPAACAVGSVHNKFGTVGVVVSYRTGNLFHHPVNITS